MNVFSKKGVAVNEMMGWILIILVLFVIVAIVAGLSGKFDLNVINSIG